MLGRFVCGLVLVVLVALLGTRVEKQNRELSRRISLQHFRLQVLRREHAHVRLRAERLGAPAHLLDRLAQGRQHPSQAAGVDLQLDD